MLMLSLEILGAAARQGLTAGQGEPGLGVARIIEPASKARQQGPAACASWPRRPACWTWSPG
jgi:hypothetical protein